MSYCRFSCLDFKSDVYAYADVCGGYTVHVAGQRITSPVVPSPDWGPFMRKEVTAAEFAAAYNAHLDSVGKAERVKIEHPDAGQCFNVPTLEDLLELLERLRREGFIVPEHALTAVREEMAEEARDAEEQPS